MSATARQEMKNLKIALQTVCGKPWQNSLKGMMSQRKDIDIQIKLNIKEMISKRKDIGRQIKLNI